MKLKLFLCLALVLSGGLLGCKSVSNSSLDAQRQQLSVSYNDKTRPMAERAAAFDNLLQTFKGGTPRRVLDKYVGWPVADTTTREVPREYGSVFVLHLNAPDGSDRWVTLKGEFSDEQVIAN